MSETNHPVLGSRYEMYLENKRVERCQKLRQNAIKRLENGELEIPPELQEAATNIAERMASLQNRIRGMSDRKRSGDYTD